MAKRARQTAQRGAETSESTAALERLALERYLAHLLEVETDPASRERIAQMKQDLDAAPDSKVEELLRSA